MTEQPHFLQRKFLDYQRSSAIKGYVCPYCSETLSQEPRLWDHAKRVHGNALALPQREEGQVRTELRMKAAELAYVESETSNTGPLNTMLPMSEYTDVLDLDSSNGTRKSVRSSGLPASKPPSDQDSLKPNIGDEVGPASPSLPGSALGSGTTGEFATPEKRIDDFGRLTIDQNAGLPRANDGAMITGPGSNPLKRGPEESLEVDHKPASYNGPATRREKALSGGSFVVQDPDFIRSVLSPKGAPLSRQPHGSAKRLYDAQLDESVRDANSSRKAMNMDNNTNIGVNKQGVPRTPASNNFSTDRMDLDPPSSHQAGRTTHKDSALAKSHFKEASGSPRDDAHSVETNWNASLDIQPQMLLQPETRPISHAQLVVEVKGIYAGLVMVEAKCIEVDEKQSRAAMEKDPGKRSELKDEQWQALIALHKTLLHEHHDFFLASQHPSASPALSRLAAKYTMPARMWRHGIHAFLEVLRHRLPASLDHMLAFIYIAYSMMALLYETVTAFEDTWIECLGDLARYRMAIEDSSSGDREIWGGVAKAWYTKAADKRPYIGRLYHHLAILARPHSLQQLAFYIRSLLSNDPFDSARPSILTLFQSILDGKTYSSPRSKALEIAYIKAHGILLTWSATQGPLDESAAKIPEGLLDSYIDRATANFKEQGIYIALANIGGLLEYGGMKEGSQIRRSIFWRAFKNAEKHRQAQAHTTLTTTAFSLDDIKTTSSPPLSPIGTNSPAQADLESPNPLLQAASEIAFTTLSTALRRHGDKNVFPFVHVMFVFLWNLTAAESALELIASFIPWIDICSFLNTLARPDTMTPVVMAPEAFPKSNDKAERPLPEDYFMLGQVWTLGYFAAGWFKHALDEEERMIELPSMAATRVERLLWLGVRIAEVGGATFYM
ncbi:MAG: hypothetical protein Q9174_002998 [Haloplaca sp. 1 TL-2023]